MINKFNIRVYGILLNGDNILVSNENIEGFKMLKLPGGGLEFGEGPKSCIIREFEEELGVIVHVEELLHTTETFIESVFNRKEQVIAIHYIVKSNHPIEQFNTVQKTTSGKANHHIFKWEKLNSKLIGDLTFEMDKQALIKLLNK
mgnify:CR=1 FL=1